MNFQHLYTFFLRLQENKARTFVLVGPVAEYVKVNVRWRMKMDERRPLEATTSRLISTFAHLNSFCLSHRFGKQHTNKSKNADSNPLVVWRNYTNVDMFWAITLLRFYQQIIINAIIKLFFLWGDFIDHVDGNDSICFMTPIINYHVLVSNDRFSQVRYQKERPVAHLAEGWGANVGTQWMHVKMRQVLNFGVQHVVM